MDKTERQLNLVALLMGSTRPLTATKIREAIYHGQGDEAFKRMFERDKQDLRELGMRLDLAPLDAWGEEGYVVLTEEATLGDLGLTPAEHAALMLAAQAWGQGELGAGSPRMAGLKLAATARDDGGPDPWLVPRVELSSPALGRLAEAIVRRKRVTFSYRPLGGEPSARTVEPHALRHRGAWYLSAFDGSRGQIRHFKLDRIEGPVKIAAGAKEDFPSPDGIDDAFVGDDRDGQATARIAFAPEVAYWAARGAGERNERPDGWIEADVAMSDPDRMASWVLSFGDHAEVLSPAGLRDAVIARLRAAAGPG